MYLSLSIARLIQINCLLFTCINACTYTKQQVRNMSCLLFRVAVLWKYIKLILAKIPVHTYASWEIEPAKKGVEKLNYPLTVYWTFLQFFFGFLKSKRNWYDVIFHFQIRPTSNWTICISKKSTRRWPSSSYMRCIVRRFADYFYLEKRWSSHSG